MSTSPEMQVETVVVSREAELPENDISPPDNALLPVSSSSTGGRGGGRDSVVSYADRDAPPADDCCPICFGSFAVPCKSNCGHWYCGSCIIQYWKYCAASRPCKCPLCTCRITKLTPLALLDRDQQEQPVLQVVEDVHRYNRIFVGGVRGVVQKVRESPFFLKRMFQHMMDPDMSTGDFYLNELRMRLFAMFLGLLYTAASFDFIPTGGFGVPRLFDYAATALVVILRLVGIYRRWRLAQQRDRGLPPGEPLVE
ncbi:hypothetical protein Tsubulata_009205 [Turnera subulata]|uniref:RING-type domain-containing protein n=1 Tax=Turnera subulata TaxID=218843 RepID=A0A9Q0FLB3_9ROSI|nr:hypothetical protein Tsubulata_009205 [Turnera subulata]